jgi:hypothetical protein
MKSHSLIKVVGLCSLGGVFAVLLNASPAYPTKPTNLLDNNGNIVGMVTPATQLDTIKSTGDLTKVRLKGWSAFGAESVVFQKMGKRIVLAFLEESALPDVKKGKVKQDVYETEWNESSIVVWVSTSDITSSKKDIWKNANKLFNERCGGCHQPHPAHEFTANQWPNIVNAMKDRAGLTTDEKWLLTKYMQNHAKDIK